MAQMTLDEVVAQLRAAYGAGLRAVVLYGSAARAGAARRARLPARPPRGARAPTTCS
jgi:hypothetical protein